MVFSVLPHPPMARPLRIQYAGALYHVTARGNERRPVFRDDVDRDLWMGQLASVAAHFRLRVFAYVLMRNHYHLLLETCEPNLSAAMRQLNGVYTQTFNRRHRRVGHLFQGRYQAIVVDKNSYLLELTRYIHLNPVRVGEVRDPELFAWSSASSYVGGRLPPAFLHVDDVLALFASRRNLAQERYRLFLNEGLRQQERPWEHVIGQTLLGDHGFVERHTAGLKGMPADLNVPALRQLRPRPALDEVLRTVASASGVRIEDIRRRRGTRGDWPRLAALYLGSELCGLNHVALGREFGITPFGVSKALAAARARVVTGEGFRQLLARFGDETTASSTVVPIHGAGDLLT